MRVLLTGASGFLGEKILSRLRILDFDVKTIGRGKSDMILYDFSSNTPLEIKDSFELVVHCAGKAHSVPSTASEGDEFYTINLEGTRRLLEGLDKSPSYPKSFIFISTIAVYGLETGLLINERAALSATDPYGISKIQAEQLIMAWCTRNKIICTILRLPLVAGPNPPGNLKAMINGIAKGFYFDIAGGRAQKSVVLAQDVAEIIVKAAAVGGTYNLTDGCHPSFSALSQAISLQLGKSKPKNLPLWAAITIAKVGDLLGKKAPLNSNKLRKITAHLTFDDSKARKDLDWNPTPVLKGFKII